MLWLTVSLKAAIDGAGSKKPGTRMCGWYLDGGAELEDRGLKMGKDGRSPRLTTQRFAVEAARLGVGLGASSSKHQMGGD